MRVVSLSSKKSSHTSPEITPQHLSVSRLQWCLQLSRKQTLMIAVVITVTVALLAYKCVSPAVIGHNFLCCGQQQVTQLPRLVAEHPLPSIDADYADYDERLEGTNSGTRMRYKHTSRRLPVCLIVGVRKGGTRALLEFLNLHPMIRTAKKEIHFFDDEDNYSMGLDWYRKKMPFSFPEQITIEKTPAYFVSEEVPERVRRMNSSIKLLLVMRDPTERAISDYTQIHANKLEKNKSHRQFEELAIDHETGEVRQTYNAVRRSIYHRHMARWLKWFPLKQFHFVSGENLVKNPMEELVKVEDFLGLSHDIKAENFYYNKTRGFYCIRDETREKCLAPSKGRKHPNISPDVTEKLQRFFRPHNLKFYKQVKRDFWWP